VVTRRPIVLYNGLPAEMPSGDQLPTDVIPGGGGSSSFSTNDVDLSASPWSAAISEEFSPFFVTATSDPGVASPHYTKTLLTSNYPVNTDVDDWNAYLVMGGFNNSASTLTLNFRTQLNSTNLTTGNGSMNVIAGRWWTFLMPVSSTTATQAGDTVGVRLWCTTTNQIDVRAASILLLPRTFLTNINGFKWFGGGAQGALSPNLAGWVDTNLNFNNFVGAIGTYTGATFNNTLPLYTPVPKGVALRIMSNSTTYASIGNLTTQSLGTLPTFKVQKAVLP